MSVSVTTKPAVDGLTLKPVAGSNLPALVEHEKIMGIVKQALADGIAADKKRGTSTQRMAFAFAAEYEHIAVTSNSDKPLSDMFMDKKARAALVKLVAGKFGIDKAKLAKGQGKDNAFIVKSMKSGDSYKVVERGAELACAMAYRGIGIDAFDAKVGMWKVAGATLLPDGARFMKPLRETFLDNEPFGGVSHDKAGNIVVHECRTSVNQFLAMALPKKPAPAVAGSAETAAAAAAAAPTGNRANAGQGAGETSLMDMSKVPTKALATAISFSKALAVFHELFVTSGDKAGKLSDLEPADRNMLQDILRRAATMKRNDDAAAVATNDKPAATA